MKAMKKLPSEVWGLVLRNFEVIGDFARFQLVSHTFHTLVKKNCWTKVRKIEIGDRMDRQLIWVFLDTAVPSQCFRLPIAKAAQLLVKLVRKTPNTTALVLTLYDEPVSFERTMEHIFHCFLVALASRPKIRMQEFEIRYLSIFHPMDTQEVLARFLNAKKQSLISLKVLHCFENETRAIPAQLLQAFRDCRALENVAIFRSSQHLLENVLHEKSQLRTLQLDASSASASAVVLVESGVTLRQFICTEDILWAYFKEVHRRNWTHNHPLRCLTKLQMPQCISSFPWVLFPSLEQLV